MVFFTFCFEQAQSDLPFGHLLQSIKVYTKIKEVTQHGFVTISVELYKSWYNQLSLRLQKTADFKKIEHFQDFSAYNDLFTDLIADSIENIFFDSEIYDRENDSPVVNAHFLPVLKNNSTCTSTDKLVQEIHKFSGDIFQNLNSPPFQRAYAFFYQSYLDYLEWNVIVDILSNNKGQKDLADVSRRLKLIQNHQYYIMPTIPSGNGYNLFHLIAEEGSITLVLATIRLLVNISASNTFPPATWNPKFLNQALIASIKNNQWTEVELCIEWGAKYDYVSPTKKNILHYAAGAGVHDRIIPFLLRKGLSPNKLEADGWSALYWALKPEPNVSEDSVLKTVQVLLQAGAKWNDLIVSKLSQPPSPAGKGNIVDHHLPPTLIIEQHPWKLVVKTCIIPLIRWVYEEHTDWLNWSDPLHQNALHWVAESTNSSSNSLLELYKMLLGFGANIQKDSNGKLPCDFIKSGAGEFKQLEVQRDSFASMLSQLTSDLNQAKALGNWGNFEEEIQSKVHLLNEANSQYELGQLYESKGDLKKAFPYYKSAADQGHRKAHESMLRLMQINDKEQLRTNLLSQRRPGTWVDDFFGQEFQLTQELRQITHTHPVFDSYFRFVDALKYYPLLEEPLDILTSLCKVKCWVYWGEMIQDKNVTPVDPSGYSNASPFSRKEIKEIQAEFKRVYKVVKKNFSSTSNMRSNDQTQLTRNSLSKGLYDYFTSHHKGKVQLVNNEGVFNAMVLYCIVFPYVMETCEELYVKLVPRATQKDHAIWRPVTQSLRTLKQHYFDLLKSRLETKTFLWPEERAILHSLETGPSYLDQKYINKLISRRHLSDVSSGTHTVLVVNGVHYKKLLQSAATDGPGIEYAVDSLNKLITHQGSPPTTLLKVRHGKMQAIYQASKTVEGVDLEFVLEYHPDDLNFLDPFNYSAMIMMGLLVLPRDGKPDNYILQLYPERKGQIQKTQLISIDNDRAFGVGLMRDRMGNIRSGVQSVLFFFPQMHKPVDPHFRDHFLMIDPAVICIRWLDELQKKNDQYNELIKQNIFTMDEFSGNSKVIGDIGLQLPIQLPEGFIQSLYLKILLLQTYMRMNDNSTHLELLSVAEPALGKVYSTILSEPNQTILQYFMKVWNRDLDLAHMKDLTPDDQQMISHWIGADQENVGKVTIEQAMESLLSMIEIERYYFNSYQVEIFLERIQKHLLFSRVLTLWSPVGLTIHQFLKFFAPLKHVETLIFKGKLNWRAEDILRITSQRNTLKITLQEDLHHNVPLTPKEWIVLHTMNNLRVYLDVDGEVFSLRCTMEQLRLQAKDKDITNPLIIDFLDHSNRLTISYSFTHDATDQALKTAKRSQSDLHICAKNT